MTTTNQPAPATTPRTYRKGSILADWLSTTDHKIIGHLYLITSFAFFLIGGLMAMIMRAQLMGPDNRIVSDQQYNELFTMHGTIMLLLFATPLFVGFANEIMPLQIGAPDVAFPRLNLLSYYMFAFGGLILLLSFLTPGGAPGFGWYAYSPLTSALYSPGIGGDMWIMGLTLSGPRHHPQRRQLRHHDPVHAGAGHDDVPDADLHLEHPAHQHHGADRVPACWPPRCWCWRSTGSSARRCSPPTAAAPILWQHLFWFFGHPEVYIVAIPFFGIATEILPVFSRKPLFGYKGMVAATIAIAGLSMTVWAHHMFTTGAVLLPFFSFMTFLIAVPTGVKFFNWVGTMWRGQLTFEAPMLFIIGFLVVFLFGGLTGVILASPPLDFAVSDSYFLVAPLPLRAVRHRGVHHVRRVLLLVAQVDRQEARQPPRCHGTSGACSSASTARSWCSTGWA